MVTEVSEDKIARAKEMIPEDQAKKNGVELLYVNTAAMEDPIEELLAITEGHGYDDVFVYVPIRQVAEMGDKLLAFDGCMNFFAGPTDNQFKAEINLYNAHYTSTHILGTTGGNNDDLIEANRLAAGIKCGTEIELQCEGENEEQELKTLVELIESGLGE